MRGGRLGVIIMAAALGACGSGSGAGSGSAKPEVAVPAFVQRMVDADFPADGQIHVQSRGKFVIDLKTGFCTFPNSFGVSTEAWNEIFLALKIPSSTPEGVGRANGPVAGCNHTALPNTVKSRGLQLTNRNGQPYKLVLTVWQGDPAKGGAVWVGEVERTPQHLHRRGEGFVSIEGSPPTLRAKVAESMNGDLDDLSREAANVLGKK